jgi:nucleotide sugar dehydrogenase
LRDYWEIVGGCWDIVGILLGDYLGENNIYNRYMRKIKLGIIGIGFVGDAVHNFFKSVLSTDSHNNINNANIHKALSIEQLLVYDKYRDGGIGSIEAMLSCDIIYLCLPTLYNDLSSSYNLVAIHSTLTFLADNMFKGLILIKSTVEPGRTAKLALKYNLKLIHNPEFLTARTAREDFANQTHIVLGMTEHITISDIEFIEEFYLNFFPNAYISTSTSTESESMKIFANSFYAIKVQAFNEFYLLCQSNGADYQKITQMMLQNGWINPMHTNVPGPDGKLSYGGACFPKDTQALLATMKRAGTPCQVLDATVKERNSMRSD